MDCSNILNENLYGLLQHVNSPPKKPRRSARLKKPQTVSGYFCEQILEETQKRDKSKSIFKEIQDRYALYQKQVVTEPPNLFFENSSFGAELRQITPNNCEQIEGKRDKTKSIFKEIQERYDSLYSSKQVITTEPATSFLKNCRFGEELSRQITPNCGLHSTNYYKKQILKQVNEINSILTGKMEVKELAVNRKRHFAEEDNKENIPLKFPYVPESKWVFQTPPNRKLNFNNIKVDENGIKPAVLETMNDKKVVYEMNSKIRVDLSNLPNTNIPIDKRYMIEAPMVISPAKTDQVIFSLYFFSY